MFVHPIRLTSPQHQGFSESYLDSSKVAARAARSCNARSADPKQQALLDSNHASSYSNHPHQVSRRGVHRGIIAAVITLQLVNSRTASALSCPGLRGYALSQCLKEERRKREAEEASSSSSDSSSNDTNSPDQQQQRSNKYGEVGELVTLPSGLQYREIIVGSGPPANLGCECDIQYIVYRLSSGGYYKYSSGGTPVYLWSLGYGNEGRDDLGETYRFRLGDPDALPAAAAAAMLGMQVGGRRRVLIPPGQWISDKVGPRPVSFGSQRRWETHKGEALLLEVELSKVLQPSEAAAAAGVDNGQLQMQQGSPFRLPAPPSPYKDKLLQPGS